jgi:hypothetical protein
MNGNAEEGVPTRAAVHARGGPDEEVHVGEAYLGVCAQR